jgi:hypothetical protein
MRFLYYRFLEAYGREPSDEADLFDGMAVLRARDELQALAMKQR